jgi:prevent-host-death family protein
MRTYSAIEVRKKFGQILNEAAAGERIVIERAGQPIAALVPLSDLAAHDPSERKVCQLAAIEGAVRLGRQFRARHGSFDAAAAIRADRDLARAASAEDVPLEPLAG